MSLQSLVLCSDEKIARVLRRVLSDLDIGIDQSPDADSAIRKLTRQRYEAVIVDCTDEQAASQVLKSARTAPCNKRAVAVAVIDGKKALRSAFDLGAHFVLYKPLSAERAKASFRAARALMKRERRRNIRVQIEMPVILVLNDGAGQQRTLTSDLGEGGMAVQSSQRPKTHGALQIQFALPGTEDTIHCGGEVAWENAGRQTGIRFVDLAPEARDLGLGTRLKLYQRELLLPLGVEVVEWTYDPLEARNAHLNLNRLGAEVVEYVEDMYKGEMGSELARGIGTDRFIVAWRIADERVRDILERLRLEGGAGTGGAAAETAGPPERFLDALTIEPAPAGEVGRAGKGGNVGEARQAGEPPLPPAPRVRIEIPARIQEFKERQPERALAWRLGTRRAFQAYLARGYQVTAFWRDAAGRCWYGVEARRP